MMISAGDDGNTPLFSYRRKDNTTQPENGLAFSLSNSSLIFGLSALFLRIVSAMLSRLFAGILDVYPTALYSVIFHFWRTDPWR